MLGSLRRLFVRSRGPHWRTLAAWARDSGHTLARVRQGEGLLVEGRFGSSPWRLEWGPSQRSYIEGRELRLRIDAGLPADLQMLLLDRALAERLERATFEQYTQTTRTYVDTATPEEMRWLAMFERASLRGPKPLRSRFVAVAMEPPAATAWLEPELAERLLEASALFDAGPPFALMTQRGRLYLRAGVPHPDRRVLEESLAIGEAALQQARRVVDIRLSSGEWPSAQTSAWQSLSGGEVSRS